MDPLIPSALLKKLKAKQRSDKISVSDYKGTVVVNDWYNHTMTVKDNSGNIKQIHYREFLATPAKPKTKLLASETNTITANISRPIQSIEQESASPKQNASLESLVSNIMSDAVKSINSKIHNSTQEILAKLSSLKLSGVATELTVKDVEDYLYSDDKSPEQPTVCASPKMHIEQDLQMDPQVGVSSHQAAFSGAHSSQQTVCEQLLHNNFPTNFSTPEPLMVHAKSGEGTPSIISDVQMQAPVGVSSHQAAFSGAHSSQQTVREQLLHNNFPTNFSTPEPLMVHAKSGEGTPSIISDVQMQAPVGVSSHQAAFSGAHSSQQTVREQVLHNNFPTIDVSAIHEDWHLPCSDQAENSTQVC